MNAAQTPRRGKPLTMLALVLAVWTGSRIVLWEAPWPQADALIDLAAPLLAEADGSGTGLAANDRNLARLPQAQADGSPLDRVAVVAPLPVQLASANLAILDEQPLRWAQSQSMAQGGAMGHQSLWMAAVAYLPVPQTLEQDLVTSAGPDQRARLADSTNKEAGRWSIDSWAFWRQGSDAAIIGQGRAPTYGASQAGAVLNYRLSPASADTPNRAPRAYVRVYRALVENGETEVAAGLSARPIARLPIRAHAEMRATQSGFDSTVSARPSAFVTTELAPQKLPLNARAEFYAQAGYVSGKDATAFADGQLHILRDVADFDLGRVSVGGAAWGGAQKGAQRIDLGPSMRVDMMIGSVPARLSVDYRERMAGTAEPDSGAAVTLSTRF